MAGGKRRSRCHRRRPCQAQLTRKVRLLLNDREQVGERRSKRVVRQQGLELQPQSWAFAGVAKGAVEPLRPDTKGGGALLTSWTVPGIIPGHP